VAVEGRSPVDGVDDVVATDGRVIGRRAIQTRRRVLDATAALLRQQGALDLKVIDVAREVGTSPATFYQYFADVEDAILCLAGELVDRVPEFAGQIDGAWTGPDGLDRARRLVAGYTRFWDDHGAVLRIMHLRADERDKRFRRVRHAYNEGFMVAMVAVVRQAQEAGRLPATMDPDATAGAMLSVLDRVPSYRESFERRGTSREAMVETIAVILHAALTGLPNP
jgi:AcrR family transcriptional regulator